MESRDGYPFRFACRRSGNCCARPGGVVRVSPGERRQIADFLSISDLELTVRHLDPSGTRLRSEPGGACTFLEPGREAACSIHPVRPEQCRTWPFWPELREDPGVLAEAMRFCPGIRLEDPEERGPEERRHDG